MGTGEGHTPEFSTRDDASLSLMSDSPSTSPGGPSERRRRARVQTYRFRSVESPITRTRRDPNASRRRDVSSPRQRISRPERPRRWGRRLPPSGSQPISATRARRSHFPSSPPASDHGRGGAGDTDLGSGGPHAMGARRRRRPSRPGAGAGRRGRGDPDGRGRRRRRRRDAARRTTAAQAADGADGRSGRHPDRVRPVLMRFVDCT
mmetsp:Transcript_21605/g.48869  ORF Transcript_21605/g.48869 Transcript_21605/m.48869 type:complete len:206 (-) Transcript_21605:35-652(-)